MHLPFDAAPKDGNDGYAVTNSRRDALMPFAIVAAIILGLFVAGFVLAIVPFLLP